MVTVPVEVGIDADGGWCRLDFASSSEEGRASLNWVGGGDLNLTAI
jgi:hypothetical protein